MLHGPQQLELLAQALGQLVEPGQTCEDLWYTDHQRVSPGRECTRLLRDDCRRNRWRSGAFIVSNRRCRTTIEMSGLNAIEMSSPRPARRTYVYRVQRRRPDCH